jgi:hypothetical protein
VKQAVWAREMPATFKWLEKKHPDWTNKQTVEHTGNINLTALSKAEIAAMSDEDLKKLSMVRKAELAALEADHVRSEAGGPAGSDQSADSTGR